MAKIISIEGIGPVFAEKLKSAGVHTTEKLLEQGATPAGRKSLAAHVGISEALVLEWVNRADLFRVRGVGEEYSDLLEAAGVDTVVELATRNPANLREKIVEVNLAKNLVRKLPAQAQVEEWVINARNLPRVIQYSSGPTGSGGGRPGGFK